MDKILKVKVTTAKSNVKLSSHHDVAHLYPQSMSYQVSTSNTLRFLRYSPEKILKLKVTMARLKVKSSPNKNLGDTKYQLSTPYGFWDIAWTRF